MIYPALLLAAVVFARHAPDEERRPVFALALLLVANWLFCGWAYADYPPQRWTYLSAPDLWALADALLGCAALALSSRWWAWTIWAATTSQVVFHLFHGVMTQEVYTFWLDRLLDVQIAVFMVMGGRGVADRISGCLSVVRNSGWLGRGTVRILAQGEAR